MVKGHVIIFFKWNGQNYPMVIPLVYITPVPSTQQGVFVPCDWAAANGTEQCLKLFLLLRVLTICQNLLVRLLQLSGEFHYI